jgi:hypothetical protein
MAEVLTIGLFLAAFAVGALLACLLVAVGVSLSVSLAALAIAGTALLLTHRWGF